MEPSKKFKRASTTESKEYRKQTILEAATSLFFENPGALPTVSEISKRCSIAKGTVYIYFSTKEQIFLTIIEELFTEFIKQTEGFILASDGVENPLESIINKLCRYFSDNRTMLYLAGMTNSIIEQNIEIEAAYEHKKSIQKQLLDLGALMGNTLSLDKILCAKLLLRTYAITLGTRQICNPPKKVQQIHQKKGAEFLLPDFEEELRQTLTPFWKGSIKNVQ